MTILGFHESEGYSLFRGQLFSQKSSDKTSRSEVNQPFFGALTDVFANSERGETKMPTVKTTHSNFVIFTSESKQKCIYSGGKNYFIHGNIQKNTAVEQMYRFP